MKVLGGDFAVFHWRHGTRERYFSATRTIQVRPSRNPLWQEQGGWEVFEGNGVSPTFSGQNAREDVLSYAKQRAG